MANGKWQMANVKNAMALIRHVPYDIFHLPFTMLLSFLHQQAIAFRLHRALKAPFPEAQGFEVTSEEIIQFLPREAVRSPRARLLVAKNLEHVQAAFSQ